MDIATNNKRKLSFYLVIGIIGLMAVVVGFFTTYISPSIGGSFEAPVIIHVHGAFAFAWVLLFVVQAISIKLSNFPLHRTLGYLGMLIAIGIFVTMPSVGVYQVKKGLSEGLGETAVSNIVGVLTSAFMFLALVGAGYFYRKKPKVHKRLLLLATIVLLWPAWFRFRHYFPTVPRPDIWFAVILADSLILFSWVADKVTYGKVHPVLLYGGLLIIAEHMFEVLMFDSEPWRFWAKSIYALLV